MKSNLIYYKKNNTEFGPFNNNEFLKLIKNNTVSSEDLISIDNKNSWLLLSESNLITKLKKESNNYFILKSVSTFSLIVFISLFYFKESIIKLNQNLEHKFVHFVSKNYHSLNKVSHIDSEQIQQSENTSSNNPEINPTADSSGGKAYIINPEVVMNGDLSKMKIFIPKGKHLYDEKKMAEVARDGDPIDQEL